VASKQQSGARPASRAKLPRAADRVADEDAEYEFAEVPPARELSSPPRASPAPSSSGAGRSSILLEALKEELFQLEVERKQGNISPQEYEKHRAALDQTLERALKREAQKAWCVQHSALSWASETSSFSFTEANSGRATIGLAPARTGGHNFSRVAGTTTNGKDTTSDYSYFITRILGEATAKHGTRILGGRRNIQ